MTRATLFGLTAMIAALAIGPALAEGVSPSSPPYIAPVRSHPLGQTYSEWAARWWQWALETPLAEADDPQSHPLTDPTGAYCDRGQLALQLRPGVPI